MKILGSTKSKTQPGKGRVKIGSDSKARRDGRYKFDRSKIGGNKIDSGEGRNDEVGKKSQKTSKSKNLFKSKKMIGSLDFFTPRVRLAFTKLRQVFVKALILHHFDPEHYIRIEKNVSGYVIGKVLSYLTLDNLGQ